MTTVLSIIPYKIFPAKVGGQKGIALFSEYFAKQVSLVSVTVVSNDPKYAKGYQVLNILSGSSSRYANISLFFTIKRLLRKYGATHLLLEHPYFGWLGILLKTFTGIKLIIHSHNIETTRWKSLGKWWWEILWWYERTTHRHADYNFFIHDDDRFYAIKEFGLEPGACITITYGIEIEQAPSPEDKQRCKSLLRQQHNIQNNETIFLFNGALDYRPNHEAVLSILEKINPLLLDSGFLYKIIICGRGLPEEMNSLHSYLEKHIIYAGFVDDITVYFKGADIFINPVVEGGGIKTKMVEALGYNCKVVSTMNGSIGVVKEEAGGLLKIVADDDWKNFAAQMINAAAEPAANIPAAFYEKFYWGNIGSKAAAFISG